MFMKFRSTLTEVDIEVHELLTTDDGVAAFNVDHVAGWSNKYELMVVKDVYEVQTYIRPY